MRRRLLKRRLLLRNTRDLAKLLDDPVRNECARESRQPVGVGRRLLVLLWEHGHGELDDRVRIIRISDNSDITPHVEIGDCPKRDIEPLETIDRQRTSVLGEQSKNSCPLATNYIIRVRYVHVCLLFLKTLVNCGELSVGIIPK